MEVAGRREEKDGDEHTTGILCDPCLGVNEEENAVFFCTVCNDFLCDVDAKKHRKAAMSKDHHLLDRNSMPLQKIGSYKDNLCSVHNGEILKYFCNSDHKSCCSVCAIQDHKHCEIEYIDSIAKEYEQSSEYKSLVKDMAELTRRLHSIKQQSMDNKSNALRVQSESVSEIRKFRLEINSILDSLESASLKEAKGTLHIDAAESTTTSCDTLMAKLQEMTSSIENLRKYKQERQLVMQSKTARAHVKDIEDTLSRLSDLHKLRDYKFILDKGIRQLLRSLRGLGHLEITEKSTKPKENDRSAKEVSGARVLIPVDSQPVAASHVRDFNTQHSTDTNSYCSITGGAIVDNNTLALTDYINNSVKVVDVNNDRVTSCIKLHSAPWDITRVEQDQVVVSCDGGKLLFLKVGKTLYIVKELDLGGDVRGIVYTNNLLLVAFDYPDSCVKVLDLRGKTLKAFKNDAAENNLFEHPQYIALSEDQNTIFVSDQGNHRVTSLRMDGTVQGVYTDVNLSYPCGLAVARKDNVYVACYMSHKVRELSAACKPIQVLLDATNGVECPWMVTYCKTENKLYIGYGSGTKKNYISVFQLQ